MADITQTVEKLQLLWNAYKTLNVIPVETWVIEDALELLKKLEPVEPEVNVDTWICSKCGHTLEHQEMLGTNVLFHEQYSYCPNCGQAVKYDG